MFAAYFKINICKSIQNVDIAWVFWNIFVAIQNDH